MHFSFVVALEIPRKKILIRFAVFTHDAIKTLEIILDGTLLRI